MRPDRKANESQTESAEKRSSRPSPWSITTVWQTQVIPSTLQHIPGLSKLTFINFIVLNLSYHTDGWHILLIRSIQFPKICVLLLAILLNQNDFYSLYYVFSEKFNSSIIIIIWFKIQYGSLIGALILELLFAHERTFREAKRSPFSTWCQSWALTNEERSWRASTTSTASVKGARTRPSVRPTSQLCPAKFARTAFCCPKGRWNIILSGGAPRLIASSSSVSKTSNGKSTG